ncbi:MAG TPA: helix-turn-helix domain-containing GNAT family N-acetyltransferase [Bryobacteraceae bacterium]|jgi:DNA-binding MarR family transcriptional regulator/GNAT superfamily N-acetyltransferase|nr:helix-turn-helix domain-containing GNAT family N-acetyltransferase [Bryobacteraceae bacterium]
MPLPDQVRAFNRFYTKHIGLLRDGYLKSPFSLTRARVLYEIGARAGIRWSELLEELALDPGYLSRIIKHFESKHLVRRSANAKDRRVSHLSLTAQGRSHFAKLNARSEAEAAAMLAKLSSGEQRRLMSSMSAIRELLDPGAPQSPITIRAHQPGDIGWVVARHGELYSQEYNWDMTFEGLVAEIAGKFLTRFDPECEHCWIAERNGERLGCIFCVKQSKSVAKLRLLLVDPAARGSGLGTRLVEECIAFARRAGYRKIVLWTNDNLHAARRIYQRAGFMLAKEEKHHSFGHDLVGQFWELPLA